jgi:hypothetical protein
MQPFHDPLGLRTLHLGPGMIDVFARYIQLILMPIRTPTILRPPIRENPTEGNFVFLKERDHLVIEQVGRRQRGLAILEFRERYLTIGIDESLLGDPPYALQRPTVERLLCPTLPRTFALEFPVGLFLYLRLL